MLEKFTLDSHEWKGLSTSEMVTYIYIKKGYNGSNNGEVPFTYSGIKGVLAPATISKSLKGLISKGWVEKTKHGGLYRFYCLYKLTGKYDQIR
jgi:DNA-binding MarR family transcriptional regulator